jgi:hypothetical protein
MILPTTIKKKYIYKKINMDFLEFLAYVIIALIPATAVIVVVYILLKKNGEREITALTMQLKKERQTNFLESRVDAYQRAVLLMERIHPNSLIMRNFNPGLPAGAFQAKLLDQIREEFDHNVAQQIFISPGAWEMVKTSKEETLKIINIAGRQMDPTAMAGDLSTKIFEIIAEVGELPTEITIKHLKTEVQKLF